MRDRSDFQAFLRPSCTFRSICLASSKCQALPSWYLSKPRPCLHGLARFVCIYENRCGVWMKCRPMRFLGSDPPSPLPTFCFHPAAAVSSSVPEAQHKQSPPMLQPACQLIMMCSVGSVERHKLHVLLMAATGVKACKNRHSWEHLRKCFESVIFLTDSQVSLPWSCQRGARASELQAYKYNCSKGPFKTSVLEIGEVVPRTSHGSHGRRQLPSQEAPAQLKWPGADERSY